jgi:hypothetical protein
MTLGSLLGAYLSVMVTGGHRSTCTGRFVLRVDRAAANLA